MYLSLYCKGSKRLIKVCLWEGVGDRTETVIFWSPLLWPSTLCLSRSPGLLNRGPSGPLCWVICYILSATSLHPNSFGGPEPLRPGVASLPHFVYNSVRTPTANLTSVLTELYDSSTTTQSPTRSLKSHVWSSSSENNCHAVHRSLSSLHQSMCVPWEFLLPCPISSASFRPRDFLS